MASRSISPFCFPYFVPWRHSRSYILFQRAITQNQSRAHPQTPQQPHRIPSRSRARFITSSSSSTPSSSPPSSQRLSSATPPSSSSSSHPSSHEQAQLQQSKHRTFYTSYTAPVLKCFLAAMFTYQLAYWIWLKLESLEEEQELGEQVKTVEGTIAREIATRQQERERK